MPPGRLRSERRLLALGFACLVAVLVAQSPSRAMGDSYEYVAMAYNLKSLSPPAVSTRDVALLKRRPELAQSYGSQLKVWKAGRGRDGRHDFNHFWMYSLLAAPFVAMTATVNADPAIAFTLLNLLLLGGALAIALKAFSAPAVLFCFLSPVLWWTDKAHTEVFTFSLLAVALALMRRKPWWSFAALGLASTQNPPIALLLPVAIGLAVLSDRAMLRDSRVWFGAAAGAILACLHPAYYLWRLGVITPQKASGGARFQLPSLREVLAPVGDLNVGLLPQWPPMLLVPVAVGMLMMIGARRRIRPSATVLLSIAAVPIFLASFAQTTNFNSGATPGMSRYAVWLIPLALPVLDAFMRHVSPPDRTAYVVVLIAAFVSVLKFAPTQSERFLRPSSLAAWVWTNHPSFDNPVPEIFLERITGKDWIPLRPAATASCSKVLLIHGYGPRDCRVAEVPATCGPDTACYANRTSDGYRFVRVSRGLPQHSPLD